MADKLCCFLVKFHAFLCFSVSLFLTSAAVCCSGSKTDSRECVWDALFLPISGRPLFGHALSWDPGPLTLTSPSGDSSLSLHSPPPSSSPLKARCQGTKEVKRTRSLPLMCISVPQRG